MKTRNKRTRTPGLYRTPPTLRFPEGGWEIRYRDAYGGTRRKTFRTKQEALDFQASVRTDKNRGDWIDPRKAKMRFSRVAEDWYASLGDLKPKTKAGYRSILDNHLLPALGAMPIGKLTTGTIEDLLRNLPVAEGTRRNVLRVLSPILARAARHDLIRRDPMIGAKLPKAARVGHVDDRQVLTAEEVVTLADAITPTYRTLVLVAAYTGMRAGEIVALKMKNVDLLHRRVKVVESVTDVNGHLHTATPKNGKVRTVAIPAFLAELLMEQMVGKSGNDYVFGGFNGGPLRHGNWYSRHFRPAVRAALPEEKQGLRFHDLRHTCASLLIHQGMHPLAVSRHLGHSSIAITMDRYGHLFPDEQERVAEALEETFQATAQSVKTAEVVSIR